MLVAVELLDMFEIVAELLAILDVIDELLFMFIEFDELSTGLKDDGILPVEFTEVMLVSVVIVFCSSLRFGSTPGC